MILESAPIGGVESLFGDPNGDPFDSLRSLRVNSPYGFSPLNQYKTKTTHKGPFVFCGDPNGDRTRVAGVKGQCPNR